VGGGLGNVGRRGRFDAGTQHAGGDERRSARRDGCRAKASPRASGTAVGVAVESDSGRPYPGKTRCVFSR